MSETKTETFQSLIQRGVLKIGDGYRARLNELGGDGPIFLRAGSLTAQGFIWEGNDKFRKDLTVTIQSKMGLPGDTVITTKGNSTGRTGYVPQDSPEFVYSPHLSYWRSLKKKQLNPGFLRYWSRCKEFTEQLESMAHGTDMAPYLSLADQRRLRITIPPLERQSIIVEIIEALDDKIAVNDGIATTAGSLLRARVQAVLNEPRERVRLRELIDLRYGKALKASDRSPGQIPVYGGNGISGSHDIALVSGPGIIVGRKGANAGSVSWSDRDFWPIDTAFYVVPCSDNLPIEFVFFLLGNTDLRGMVGDSAIPGLNRDIALSLEVSIPRNEVIEEFARNARDLLALQSQMRREAESIVGLRDMLLPRLMSGEIRVRDAEKVVEEAT